jgi:hypothetical protein
LFRCHGVDNYFLTFKHERIMIRTTMM